MVETNSADRNSAFTPPDARLARHRRQHPRVPRPRGEEGPAAAGICSRFSRASATSPTPSWTGCSTGRSTGPLGLHRGAPGRHAEPDQVGQDGLRVGDGAVAVARGRGGVQPRRGALPQEGGPPAAGDQQPPRADPPPRRHRDERADRGRHLRQRQLDPRSRHLDHERHRRLRRLRPQRLPLDLHDPLDRQERRHLLHRADGRATSTTPSTTCR